MIRSWCEQFWGACCGDRAEGSDTDLDCRRLHGSAPRLSGTLVDRETVLEQAPFSGHVFVFRGKRGDLIKLLWFDGDGLCLFQKRLERGRFIWPQATSGTVSLTRAQLSMLLEGIDWRQPQRTWEPQSAG